jgi:hypothetical protein
MALDDSFHFFDDLVVADFDGDGRLDLAASWSGFPDSGVDVLRGIEGGFAPAQRLPMAETDPHLAAARLAGGGRTDLVVWGVGSAVAVLEARADGTFAPERRWTAGAEVSALAVGSTAGSLRQAVVASGAGVLTVLPGTCAPAP